MALPVNFHQFYLNGNAIKTIPIEVFLLIVSIFTLFMALSFYRWYKNFVQARIMLDTPTAKIRSAAQGYVELSGIQKCLPQKPTIAFLSKARCTWYRYTIEHATKDRWFLIENGASNEAFILEDETGVCIIDPKGAQITTTNVDTWQGFSRYPEGKPKNWFMRLLGTLGRYRYREWRMEEGMALYAIGNFHTIQTEDNTSVNILSGEGLSKRSPFVISGKSQQKIIRAFKWNAFFWLIGYITLFVIICWLVVARFG